MVIRKSCRKCTHYYLTVRVFAHVFIWQRVHQSKVNIVHSPSTNDYLLFYYASPSSGEAYRDRRLTTNFEFLSWNFLCADMFPCEDSETVSVRPSVCPYPEKRYHHSFVNISPSLVIDTSMERSSRVLQHGNPKIWFFFFKKVRNSNFDLCWRAEITLASSISVLH